MKNGLAFLFLMVFILQVPTMGEAANWVKVAESESTSPKMIRYVDTESIVITKSGGREVWTKSVFDPPKDTTDNYGQKVNLDNTLSFILYTVEKYYCTKEIVEYYTNGKSSSYSYPCDLKKIPPETIGEAVWKFLYK